MTTPSLQHIADLSVRVAAPIEIGDIPGGARRVIGIAGGEVAGPRIKGKILPMGADYQLIRTDGVAELDARYVIQCDQGELIYVQNFGIRHGPPEAMERLRRGEPVDPALIYFRSIPRFETAAPGYQWLTRNIFVGSGARFPDHVELAIFQLS